MKYLKFTEATLTAEDRRNIPDEDYGIPSLKKYPMPDESHVRAAIRFFNKAPAEHKPELARRIKAKMKQYSIPDSVVGENNELRKYL